MKKLYENIEMEVIFLVSDDVIKTSSNDNITFMPDGGFPDELP